MKSKKAIFILLPVTLLVWGIIGYRIYFSLSGETVSITNHITKPLPSDNQPAIENYEIVANYKDPFLKSNHRVNYRTQKSNQAVSQIKSVLNLPAIKYTGMIKKPNKELAMITIDGHDRIMKVNDVEDEVHLLKIYRDSIQIAYKGEKCFIKK